MDSVAGSRLRLAVICTLGLLVVLIGVSRIWLGVHDPTDVIAGWTAGWVIVRAYVDEGTTLKRFRPRAQGRAFKIMKRTSHITIEVATPDEFVEATPSKTKGAVKPAKKEGAK